jgi:hypothetical protein
MNYLTIFFVSNKMLGEEMPIQDSRTPHRVSNIIRHCFGGNGGSRKELVYLLLLVLHLLWQTNKLVAAERNLVVVIVHPTMTLPKRSRRAKRLLLSLQLLVVVASAEQRWVKHNLGQDDPVRPSSRHAVGNKCPFCLRRAIFTLLCEV